LALGLSNVPYLRDGLTDEQRLIYFKSNGYLFKLAANPASGKIVHTQLIH
jgi:hypothetical protein